MTSTLSLGDASRAIASHVASEGGVSLDFDLSFIVQMVVFTALVFTLKPLLFDPLLALFEERERRIDGAKVVARKMDEEAGQMLLRYESELDKVRVAAAAERERIRNEATKLEAKILAEARVETSKIVDEGKARIAAEATATRTELAARAAETSRAVAVAVLGREIV